MIRLGALGDVVRTLPAVAALRRAHPGAHLAWLVEPAHAGVLRGATVVDEVIEFPRPALAESLRRVRLRRLHRDAREFLGALRGRRFDLVLDFHAILRSAVLSRLSGAPRRVTYAPPFARERAHLFATDRVVLPAGRISRFERNAALVAALGVDPEAGEPFSVAARQRHRPGPAPVAIHPGSSPHTPHKRYPAAAWAEVARQLARRVGAPCIVTRGPSPADLACARAVVAAAGGAARLAPETRSPADLARLFAGCRLAVGADTGPLHLASLVGTPVVQLLGPTDPVENAPWHRTPSRSLRAGFSCSPCRSGCASAGCMPAIAPAAVVAAASELLAPPSQAAALVG